MGSADGHHRLPPVARAGRDVDRPDELRIDLDPQPGTDFADAARAAGEVRALLDELGATGWPKTLGGRGVHVYLRIQPRWTFTEVRRATIALAREVERRNPDLVTTAWWKEERGTRVFVDFNQMARDRTIACAYSLRANARATVSTPVSWDELPDVDPDDFDLRTVPARLAERGDPHAGIDDAPWDITPLLEWAERDAAAGQGDLPSTRRTTRRCPVNPSGCSRAAPSAPLATSPPERRAICARRASQAGPRVHGRADDREQHSAERVDLDLAETGHRVPLRLLAGVGDPRPYLLAGGRDRRNAKPAVAGVGVA